MLIFPYWLQLGHELAKALLRRAKVLPNRVIRDRPNRRGADEHDFLMRVPRLLLLLMVLMNPSVPRRIMVPVAEG